MNTDQDRHFDRFSFGPFTLSVPERLLLRNGTTVQIGSRSLDILITLVGDPGRVIGKRQIMERVWGELTVDEGALRVHISELRKALADGRDGARYVATVPGRGYSFVAPVHKTGVAVKAGSGVDAAQFAGLLPMPRRMVGREGAVHSLVGQIKRLRFVSLVGPGGIGKTTVAVRALHQLRASFDGDIHFISLSSVTDPQLVELTVASMVGPKNGLESSLPQLLSHLRQRKCLLVLDSCEHVIEPVARLASAIMDAVPDACLLTTTREPLRIEGEHVIRLPTLDCPPNDPALTAAEIAAYPAVELFVERVSASVPDFKLTAETAPVVADICRKLDGVALAIELGAGRVEAYGVFETARLLERRLGLLWQGRRTAPPRHQTLHATLEWSHGLLKEAERIVFARLAIFAGPFTLRAAEAVAADGGVKGPEVVEIIAGLVAKSLVSTITDRLPQHYRLLDTTRTYALEKLAGRDDAMDVARRHAKFLAAELQPIASGDEGSADIFMERLSDVRSAFEWCFLEGGDTAVGVALAAAAAAPLVEHSLCGECQRWTELAIANLRPDQQGTALELELQISLGWSAMYSAGKGDAGHGAFLRGLAIAESDPNPYQQLRLLNGLSYVISRRGDLVGGLELAQRAAEVALQTSDEAVIALSRWNVGVYLHLCGHQNLVRHYCESALAPPASSFQARRIADYGYDYRGRALIARARALCLLGFPSQAATAAQFAIGVAEDIGHPLSLFVVLIHAAIGFIWCNEWRLAEGAIVRLRSDSQTHTLIYRMMGAALEAVLNCRRRAGSGDIDALRQSLKKLVEERHLILVPLCRTTLAEALLEAGSLDEAREIIDAAESDLGATFIGAEAPEIFRVKGTVLTALGQEGGEAYLLRARELARTQSALWWELRAAVSLSRISVGPRQIEALADLRIVYDRFTEGHGTDDLQAAASLLRAV